MLNAGSLYADSRIVVQGMTSWDKKARVVNVCREVGGRRLETRTGAASSARLPKMSSVRSVEDDGAFKNVEQWKRRVDGWCLREKKMRRKKRPELGWGCWY